ASSPPVFIGRVASIWRGHATFGVGVRPGGSDTARHTCEGPGLGVRWPLGKRGGEIMSERHPAARLAVDIGGTFTDIVLLAGERRFVAKVLTTPKAPETAVID